MSRAMVETATSLVGLFLAVSPLALWVAWNEAVFYGVLLAFCLALALFLALCRHAPDEPPPRDRR